MRIEIIAAVIAFMSIVSSFLIFYIKRLWKLSSSVAALKQNYNHLEREMDNMREVTRDTNLIVNGLRDEMRDIIIKTSQSLSDFKNQVSNEMQNNTAQLQNLIIDLVNKK